MGEYYASELFMHKLTSKIPEIDSNGRIQSENLDSNGVEYDFHKNVPNGGSTYVVSHENNDSNGENVDENNSDSNGRNIVEKGDSNGGIYTTKSDSNGGIIIPLLDSNGETCSDSNGSRSHESKFNSKLSKFPTNAESKAEVEVEGDTESVANERNIAHVNIELPCSALKVDSPSLRSAKGNIKGVKKKIEEFENAIAIENTVKRSKVRISPNKIKRKVNSVKIAKNVCSSTDKSDKKPHRNDKNDKKLSIDKINLIGSIMKEEVEAKKVEDKSNHVEADEFSNVGGKFERKNAFDVLMKQFSGGCITPVKPKRCYKRKKIGLTPKGSNQKSLREWIKKD